jgi:hypothetical protein
VRIGFSHATPGSPVLTSFRWRCSSRDRSAP